VDLCRRNFAVAQGYLDEATDWSLYKKLRTAWEECRANYEVARLELEKHQPARRCSSGVVRGEQSSQPDVRAKPCFGE